MADSLPDLQAIAARILPARPRVAFFDAVGTLFGIRGSVGEIYRDIAAEFGVTDPSAAADLNRAFGEAFRAAPPAAFPDVAIAEIPTQERAWWRAVVAATFAGAHLQVTDFEAFFAVVFEHFATAAPWELYPDTIAALAQLQAAGTELGIISNFDSRLPRVLQALGIARYFQSVTVSTLTGAAKPAAQIFQVALAKHATTPEAAWHIGDSRQEDWEGARAAGLQATWLVRPSL
ncbi:MAG: HAD-IA family hydrolase [Cyanobacteria bacterium J06641_5]